MCSEHNLLQCEKLNVAVTTAKWNLTRCIILSFFTIKNSGRRAALRGPDSAAADCIGSFSKSCSDKKGQKKMGSL